MSGVMTLTVGADEGESRLDRWLRKRIPEITQGQIEKLCRTGQIRVDGGRVKAANRVAAGMGCRAMSMPSARQRAWMVGKCSFR